MTKEEFMELGVPEEIAGLAAEASAAELDALRVESAIRLALTDACDGDIAASLVDRSLLTVGEDGSVEGLAEQLEALRRDKPFLFRRSGFAVGAGRGLEQSGAPARGAITMRDAIMAKILAQRA